MHKWNNVDFSGTKGWFECEVCGHRRHFKPDEVVEPASDLLVYDPICETSKFYTGTLVTCEELVEAKAKALFDKLAKCNTPAIMKCLATVISK